MLSFRQIDVVIATIDDAIEAARDGHLADGYDLLLAELHRAEDAASQEIPWGDDLAYVYRCAIVSYERWYGILLD